MLPGNAPLAPLAIVSARECHYCTFLYLKNHSLSFSKCNVFHTIIVPHCSVIDKTHMTTLHGYSVGAAPKLYQLHCLRVGDRKVKVAQSVVADWMVLGLALEFDDKVLKEYSLHC